MNYSFDPYIISVKMFKMILFIGIFTLSSGDNLKNIINVIDIFSVTNHTTNVTNPSLIVNTTANETYSPPTNTIFIHAINVTDPSLIVNTTTNVTYPPPTNSNVTYRKTLPYCSTLISLHKQTINCPVYDYCCRILVYEDQFTKEENNCKISKKNTELCNNLKSCKSTCKSKIPLSYSCINRKSGYNQVLDSCYENCFYKEYNCPIKMNSKDKVMGSGEIILIVMFLSAFVCCICRYTICNDFHLTKRRPSSTVHVTNTDSNLLHV